MALVNRPDYTVKWAESGNKLQPTSEKVELGHVVEKPPYELVNWIENKQDAAIAYVMQEGISDWSLDQDYSATSLVKYGGIVYKAKVASIGKQPDIETAVWEIAFVDYGDYVDLTDDLYNTKNTAGYAANLVYKNAPVMTARADGTSYKADIGTSLTPTDNVGYVFDGKETDGIFHDGDSVVAQKNGAIVAAFDQVQSLTERTDTVVTMSVLQQIIDSIKEPFAPVGSIVAMATRVVPTGYLECNGNTVSRTNYADLFSKIGTTFGTGDGSTTFNLPDLRGEFIRGFDSGRGIDSSRQFGSNQTESFKSHNHKNGVCDDALGSGTSANVYGETLEGIPGTAEGRNQTSSGGLTNARQGFTSTEGGVETRPRNVALMYVIKY